MADARSNKREGLEDESVVIENRSVSENANRSSDPIERDFVERSVEEEIGALRKLAEGVAPQRVNAR